MPSKRNKQKKKNDKVEKKEPENEETIATQTNAEEEPKAEEEKVEEIDPITLTPEERATKYMDEQYQVFNKFISEMAPDVKKLESEPDFTGKL